MPVNVLTKNWMPQNDILAHPNVKLFISHGGLLGSQESIYYGVPMLGIPFVVDQHMNTDKAALQRYALKLQFNNVTVASLRCALSELLQNPVYTIKAKEISSIFRDRPESAVDRAIYWVEYVLRFRGARHLHSVGRDLPWYSYLMLDIVGVIAIGVLVSMVGIWLTMKSFFKATSKTKRIKDE